MATNRLAIKSFANQERKQTW